MNHGNRQIAVVLLLSVAMSACSSSGSSSDDDDGDDGTPPVEVTPSPTTAGEVIFTEIMPNPEKINDAVGEWFEVRNETAGDINLRDCMFSDAAMVNFTVGIDLIFGPGEYRTFSRGATPGFPPDYVYNADNIILDNTEDTVTLTCSGVTIDFRTYPNPVPPSDSYALSSDASKWCYDDMNNYDIPDSGTPGAANIVCP